MHLSEVPESAHLLVPAHFRTVNLFQANNSSILTLSSCSFAHINTKCNLTEVKLESRASLWTRYQHRTHFWSFTSQQLCPDPMARQQLDCTFPLHFIQKQLSFLEPSSFHKSNPRAAWLRSGHFEVHLSPKLKHQYRCVPAFLFFTCSSLAIQSTSPGLSYACWLKLILWHDFCSLSSILWIWLLASSCTSMPSYFVSKDFYLSLFWQFQWFTRVHWEAPVTPFQFGDICTECLLCFIKICKGSPKVSHSPSLGIELLFVILWYCSSHLTYGH